MIWIIALGLGLLALWLWRARRASGPPPQGDYARWKRDQADKERAQRRPQPPSSRGFERQRHNAERHY